VVALALGWFLLAEQVTPRMIIGVALILLAVALIVWSANRTQKAEPRVELVELAA
jgi:drug/metabolite transporter (DMT)-like permease